MSNASTVGVPLSTSQGKFISCYFTCLFLQLGWTEIPEIAEEIKDLANTWEMLIMCYWCWWLLHPYIWIYLKCLEGLWHKWGVVPDSRDPGRKRSHLRSTSDRTDPKEHCLYKWQVKAPASEEKRCSSGRMSNETANDGGKTSLSALYWYPQQNLNFLCNLPPVERLLKSADFIWNEWNILRCRVPAKELE